MAKFQNSNDSISSGDSPPISPRHVHLDGRTLEGGGQLVRNALALSALTSRPVTVNHIRGNRGKGGGLKSSHAAAVKLLAEISGSKVTGGEVGSKNITFEPEIPADEEGVSLGTTHKSSLVSLSNLTIQSEYNIKLPTPGSAFLIFQALYPYLLHVGSRAATDYVKVTITGGTNGTSAPSYDYTSQVAAPNFARIGLPPLSLELHKRGWTVGPIEMGSVSFHIHPLIPVLNEQGVSETHFPKINIMDYERGKITNIDLTVLAPEIEIPEERKTVRNYIEKETRRSLRKALQSMDSSNFDFSSEGDDDDDHSNQASAVPISMHTSESTHHASQGYVLIVAHTSTGFRIGYDALIGSSKSQGPPKSNHKNTNNFPKYQNKRQKHSHKESERIKGCIDNLVAGFFHEIVDHELADTGAPESKSERRSFLDQHMRDQIVVFEALGEVHGNGVSESKSSEVKENDKYWSLHTKTAKWVCQKMLIEPTEAQT
ncbi:hypothetical protein N7478_007701 [Penicillium angulare]|uniref:uncharacterized protein n=1 Tax=Penicillium angulare TaxID=116970 RepID=UPI0025414EC0|nr:uncharacterized protein N7478_007701 [Penicillium angulare]KAJ5272576.1 hypothetical protein N7478_007701 [Penicillium angulare]